MGKSNECKRYIAIDVMTILFYVKFYVANICDMFCVCCFCCGVELSSKK